MVLVILVSAARAKNEGWLDKKKLPSKNKNIIPLSVFDIVIDKHARAVKSLVEI